MIKILLLTLSLTTGAWAKTKLTWWHAMGGKRLETMNEIAKKFNATQSEYELEAIYRGNYTETLNSAVAAYRGKKQPHIVQVFEVGTMTMMNSGAIYPVHELLKDHKKEIDWSTYLQPVLSYYQDNSGKLLSMPFNSSTPIMYVNKELLAKAKIKEVATTWEQMYEQMDKFAKLNKCGLTVGWQSWVLLENFSAIHGEAFADKENGFAGLATTLKIKNKKVISLISELKKRQKTGGFSYEGRRSDPARNAFVGKKCAYYIDSSSNLTSVQSMVKFKWQATAMPYLKGTKPQNSIIGGATLWIFQGHKEKEYKGVAEFLAFLGGSEIQAWWHKETGYLPISLDAYKMLKTQGYYKTNPDQEVAVNQLQRATPNSLSRGLRLGNFTQIRDVLNEELEKIWASRSTGITGLEAGTKRSNALLKRYARTQERKK
jgi:sn-glycerol 3-phosphate transport system substrate-binding protein